MIRRGRPVVDADGAAAILHMTYKTVRNKGIAQDPKFPPPVNPGRRKLLYDLDQVHAYAADEPLPALLDDDHPDDLLDEHEAAELLGVAYATIRKDRSVGRLPAHTTVCGVAHWPRAVLERVPVEMRPGQGVGGGRPPKPRA